MKRRRCSCMVDPACPSHGDNHAAPAWAQFVAGFVVLCAMAIVFALAALAIKAVLS